MKNFSFTDYLYRKAFGKSSNDRGKAEVEAMNEVIGKRAPYEFDNSFSMRALTAQGTDSAGGYTVDDNVADDKIFDNFYQTSYFLSNATILDNLKSNISVTSKSTPITISKGGVTETTTAANTPTDPVFSKVTLKPKHVRISIDVSSALLEQTSDGISRLILNDLQGALSEEFDRQIFKGVSSDNEISAISGTTGVNSDTWGDLGSLAGAAAASKTIASEKNLGDAKIPLPHNFIINSETRAKFRSLRQAGLSYPILNEQHRILGYPTYTNESLADGDCWFINPEQVVVGMWGPRDMIDLIVDGHSKFNKGIVTLTASINADASLISPKALSVISES